MTGTERLREQLDAMQSSLRAFDAPVVDEHPGLRLMAKTLREREAHIRRQIERNETCTITLQLRGVGEQGAVPAGVVGALLAAADAAVAATAAAELLAWDQAPGASTASAASTLHLREVQIDDDVTVTLARPPGPLAAQLAHPASQAPFAESVMAKATAHLVAAAEDAQESLPSELRDALHALADIVIETGSVLEWQLEPYALESRSVTLDQATAQRVLRHTSG